MSSQILISRSDDVWTISLNRPEKRNALSAGIVDELLEAVEHAPKDGARVLVFKGEGKCLSAGFDFTDVEHQSEGDLLLRFVRIEQLLQAVSASSCLTVSLAHGRNFGAGVDLAAACRLRVATADATFRMPGLKFGLVLGTRRFGQLVGMEQAARVLQQSAVFDSTSALAMGFLHRIEEASGWEHVVSEAKADANVLSSEMRARLYDVLSTAKADVDLAELVRSAAKPGLKDRIADYLKSS